MAVIHETFILILLSIMLYKEFYNIKHSGSNYELIANYYYYY